MQAFAETSVLITLTDLKGESTVKAFKITTDDKLILMELPDRGQLFMAMREAINCDYIGILTSPLEELNDEYCIIYDDEALLHGEPEINHFASMLYGYRQHHQPICGDILVMKNHYNDEGELETVGMTKQDCSRVASAIWHELTC
jgi:hypothetical protein